MPKISIIIPIYNVEKYIQEAIESVINQTLKDIEIICIDDCSIDASLDIVKEYAQKDERIRIFQQKENKGQGCARNLGIKNAISDYIMFLDPDDYFEPDTCEIVYNQITKNNNDFVVFNFYDLNQETGKKVINKKFLKPYEDKFKETEIKLYEFERPFIQGCVTVMNIYKRSFLVNNDIKYAEDIRLGEDVIFYFKVIACADTMSIINKPLYTYRHHKKSSSNIVDKKLEEHFVARERAYDIINNSKHKKELIKSCIRYIITSNMHWYRKWFPQKNIEHREDFYNKLRLMFQKVDDNNDVEAIKPYINYNEFKYIYSHTCEEFDNYQEVQPIPINTQQKEEKASDFLISYLYNNNDYEYAVNLFAMQKIIEKYGYKSNIMKYNDFIYSENTYFNDFAKEFLSFSEEEYNIYEAKSVSAEKKGIIYLSDDIICDIEKDKHISLLNFADDNCKKILMSGTIITNNIPKEEETIELMKSAFNSFDFISVSDRESQNSFKNFFGLKTDEIISHIFMLSKDEYNNLTEKSLINVKKKIVFHCENMIEIETDTPIYTLNIEKNTIYDYIKAIKDCKLFITDSINSVYLALLFNTPFVYINKKFNSKIFKNLKIKNNVISDINELNLKNNYIPDWTYINNYINTQQEKYNSLIENILKNGYSNNKKAIKNKKKNWQYLIKRKDKKLYKKYLKYRFLSNIPIRKTQKYYMSKKKNIINNLNMIFDE